MNAVPKASRVRLPPRRKGVRVTLGTNGNRIILATGEYPDGTLGEIFLDHSREGTFSRDMTHAFAMAVSIGLQHGVPLKTFQSSFRALRMEPDLLRMVFEELENHYPTK